ncbi:hypothetical protein PoB_006995600 [Plakobranchus ocellatus]|uniref:Uncharacterized protein n=1 Tax=Plakobranchus ocellatus TaxID=259542 RepID=A0AAV4DH31_9GAST|nr:hypothetical protein PoB_006995600 [Plakobranchus ocellatus]
MFPWDDRGDGHPTDTTLLNTLAPVLVAHGLLTHDHNKVISGFQAIGQARAPVADGARNHEKRIAADLKADALATVLPTPLFVGRSITRPCIIFSILKSSTPGQTSLINS